VRQVGLMSHPFYLEKKGRNPDHHSPKNPINYRDIMCRTGVIQMSTNNEGGAQNRDRNGEVPEI